jgi:ABC-type amino acid transport substrate-binding protein
MKINITKTQRARLVKDWLNDMFSDAKMSREDKMFLYYIKKGKREPIGYQNNGNKMFWFDDDIWSFLTSMFSLDDEELIAISEDWLEESLNLKGYTIYCKI